MGRSDRMYSIILRNALKCTRCFDIIESTHVHDFKYCKCRSWFVDGGKEYIRRGCKPDVKMWDLSEFAE